MRRSRTNVNEYQDEYKILARLYIHTFVAFVAGHASFLLRVFVVVVAVVSIFCRIFRVCQRR